jgi:hypothetical protein
MDHLVLRHPSYMRGFTCPFSLSVCTPSAFGAGGGHTRWVERGWGSIFWKTPDTALYSTKYFLCPFAVYYLRYGVRSFFTMSRISLADGKTAGQKVHREIAVAVQKVKTFVHFIPLF